MTLEVQFWTIFMMFLGGLALGAIFDLFRVLHTELKLPRWTLALMDTIYWVAATVLIFRMLYASNEGQLRLFVFIGMAAGACFYAFVFSKPTVRVFLFIIEFVKTIYKIGVRIVRIFVVKPAIGLYRAAIVLLGFLRALTLFLYKIMLQLLYPFWKIMLWMLRPLLKRLHVPALVRRGSDTIRRWFRRKRKDE